MRSILALALAFALPVMACADSLGGNTAGAPGPAANSSNLGACVFLSNSPNTGQQMGLACDSSGNLKVNVAAGGAAGGTSSTFGAAFPTTGTAIGAKNGANMVNLSADGSNNLNVNCAVGCSGGSASNASDAVATSSTNGTQNVWLFAFNGTTFDRLRDDTNKNLLVGEANGANVVLGNNTDAASCASANSLMACERQLHTDMTSAIPAGSNTIGSVNAAIPTAGTGPNTILCSLQIKATATACGSAAAHNMTGFTLDNTGNSAASQVQVFNLATGSVTLGSTVPAANFSVPANGTSNLYFNIPVGFGTALTVACTTLAGGSAAPTSNCGIVIFGN